MMYDLNELNQDNNLIKTECGSPRSDADVLKVRALLAIAERLEALVDIQGSLCEIQQKVLWQIEGDK